MDQNKLSFPIISSQANDPCCGSSLAPPAREGERAGYVICRFVDGFIATDAGRVPRVATRLDWLDRTGLIRTRVGLFRDNYLIAPGLYCVGEPDYDSPVLVTANYKLTFDYLRRDIVSLSAWILVLDTRGVNVWCASAHKTFGTDELLSRIKATGLEKVVSHRRLIVPQLGAPGVDAMAVRKASGFEVLWGPLRTSDLARFLANSCQADSDMRRLTFTLSERLLLAPVELNMAIKPSLIVLAVMLVISGLGPEGFVPGQAWFRWLQFVLPAFLAGLLSGTILLAVMLPWLPFRPFYLKGFLVVAPLAGLVVHLFGSPFWPEILAQLLIALLVSSFFAMNFTGATPYASPSGVEKEMRSAIPVQVVMALVILSLWVASPFVLG